MQPQTKHQPDHLVLDEHVFQQLLSAAYTMQEHNARLRKAPKAVVTSYAPSLGPSSAKTVAAPPPEPPPATAVVLPKVSCPACGNDLADDPFCSHCGAQVGAAGGALQKSWASLWEMHHAADPAEKLIEQEHAHIVKPSQKFADEDAEIELFPAELEEIVGKFSEADAVEELPKKPEARAAGTAPHRILEETSLVTTRPRAMARAEPSASEVTPASPWASALKARAWLESLRTEKPGSDWLRRQWKDSRGNIYIGLAALVLLVVAAQWATHSPPQPTTQPRQLSPFEQLLVTTGLAEPPPAPEVYHGNPNTKVWVDVHTALYYCPGAELYGKSDGGRVTTQLDAQRDRFQPSTRKPCD